MKFSRDGMLVVKSTDWDFDGTLRVRVEYLGEGTFPVRRGRTLARSCLSHPGDTRSSRAVQESKSVYTYYVSRNSN